MTAKRNQGVNNSAENINNSAPSTTAGPVNAPAPSTTAPVGRTSGTFISPETKNRTIIRNTLGKEVPEKDYFYGGFAPASFTKMCGKPVDREDLIEVFHKVFKPEDNILFYKSLNKEVYLVIVPLRYSTSVSAEQESLEGDFQKHAISFIGEGSVNLETLKSKLTRIVGFVNYDKR